ncbi:glycosyltransferase family 4 protein [Candidatus Micrarchaeota archaeon]|nr:glycosyltransferase family 4 protein [Candidatus Micrarchaeota archaeon]
MLLDMLSGDMLVGKEVYGIKRYINEISKRVPRFGVSIRYFEFPRLNPILAKAYLYLVFPLSYLFSSHAKVCHMPSQTSAFLTLLPVFRGSKKVVTVYDIAPYIVGEKSFVKRLITILNIEGIKRSDGIIAISEFTKQELVLHLKLPPGKISVVYPAVDHSMFAQKKAPKSFYKKYAIPKGIPIILYVGSEEPRQNLPTLAKALGALKKKKIPFVFLKLGRPAWPNGRESLLNLLKSENLSENTIIIDYIPDEQLPLFYNIATVLAYPCSYTGFGLPPLEAMACGCPVVTSNAVSLPEVVGQAGLLISPSNPNAFASSIERIIKNPKLRGELKVKGLAQSKKFNWENAARQTAAIYKKLALR